MVRILYRDEQVVVADKPAGILTVPGRGDASEALIAQVREEAPGAMAVHRLDRNTSGAVIFALGREAHRALNAVFETRRAEKTYLALVLGDVTGPRRIDFPLASTRRGGMRVAMPAHRSVCGGRVSAAAARATTRFKSLSTAVHSAQPRRCAATASRSVSGSSPSR